MAVHAQLAAALTEKVLAAELDNECAQKGVAVVAAFVIDGLAFE